MIVEILTLATKYWPVAQIANFWLVPLPLRVLYQNLAMIGWATMMTLTMKRKREQAAAAASDDPQRERLLEKPTVQAGG